MSKATRQRSARERLREERRRQSARARLMRRVYMSLGAAVVIAAIVVTGVLVQSHRQASGSGQLVLPKGLSSASSGISVSQAQFRRDLGAAAPKPSATPAGDAPVLDLYEDFQCPVCERFEQTSGVTVQKLAAEGEVKVVYHPIAIIDERSVRSGAAAGCALDAGKFPKYHDVLYANQPSEQSGTGFTESDLKGFGKRAGLSGAAFDKCVDSMKYGQWVKASTEAASKRGVNGTPSAYLDGKPLPIQTLMDPNALTQAITSASAKS